ncbi:Glycosyl transferase [Lysobacter dokdonensis DS-58]|uniref:Glycosyl transferase n=1 Tax=Lysobacter dokdonensis DS-58 TaxID=1300345 RepID=A0A0A2WF79_9GAMM|nr:glycosyltransferase [Lysobacter dokdonensis]KGQ18856.1 Glycosyl transferase [Lysobacter dokdonensis DS-58]
MTDSRRHASGKPTVLVLASTYPRWEGDVEPGFVHQLCKRLVARFHVIALVPHAQGALSGDIDGVEVIRYRYAPARLETLVYGGGIAANLRRSKWKYLLLPTFVGMQWLAVKKLLRTRRIDAIHAHWLIPQGWVARAATREVPYLVTSHGGDLFGLRGNVLTSMKRDVAQSSAAMTVVSSAMAAEARRIGLSPPRLDILPMGVDLRERFVPDPSVTRESDVLLAVGRLVPKKGFNFLLDAMPAIVRARPNVRLDIAGFGPEEAALRAQAERLGVSQHVRFLGAMPQDRLPALYRASTLLVAPFVRDDAGDQEGLPVVLMEAIGCGCPVVVGDVAGVDDLLSEMKSEVCVDPRDPAALANAVIAALDDPATLARRAESIRAIAASRVDWEHIARAYGHLIAHCIEGRRA